MIITEQGINEALQKLVKGETYFIKYLKAKEDERKKFRKYVFKQIVGKDKLLFETAFGGTPYNETFSIIDYMTNQVSILSRTEYKNRKNEETWEQIDKVIKS